jgi:hypothetical protein
MISTCVKGSMGEEPYDGKLSRTVLKRGLAGDCHSYFNDLVVGRGGTLPDLYLLGIRLIVGV